MSRSVVFLSVCKSVCHAPEHRKNGWTDRRSVWDEDSLGLRNIVLDGRLDFLTDSMRPSPNYIDHLFVFEVNSK